jgi:cyclopropane fatty-acyl-phospholipid synthase-like methyltransferase
MSRILEKIRLKKSSRILDVGCGSGFTLHIFRSLGYSNSIGIDNSTESSKLCEKKFWL